MREKYGGTTKTLMLKSITKGTIFGAGLGATAGVVYGVAHQFLNAKPVKTDLDYLDSDGELVYLCDEIHRVVQESGKAKEASASLATMMKSLNRLMALNLLIEESNAHETKPSWIVTAHHHVETTVDAIRVLRSIVQSNKLILTQFETIAAELQDYMNNVAYNISMQLSSNINA